MLRLASLLVLVVAAHAAAAEGFLHAPPAEAKPGVDLVIEGSLLDDSAVEVVLKLRVGGKSWEALPLALQYGDLYRVTIAGDRLPAGTLEYYLEGRTKRGDVVALFASAGKPARVPIGGAAPEPKPKCKKTKKGKKCEDDPVEAAPAPQPSPTKEPVKPPERLPSEPTPSEPPVDVPDRQKPPAERPPERVKPAEPSPTESMPSPSEPPRKRSELEEELAMYAAEETGAVVQHVDDASARSPLGTTVLTAGQLKQLGVRYVYEALDLVPGLTVTRDVQGTFAVAVRGLRSTPDVLITLNGQRLNAFYDGKALAQLPVDTLERIEITRGPATADVGLGNLLAVVNLVTNRQSGFRASATGGRFTAFDGHLSAAKSFGGLTLFADGDVATQAGAKTTVVRDGLTTATPGERTTNDTKLLVNAGAGASYETTALGKLTLQGRFLLEQRAALIGRFDVVGNDSQLEWLAIQSQLAWERRFGPAKLSAIASFDQQMTRRHWQLTPDGFQFRANDPATAFPQGVQEEQRVSQRALALAVKLDVPLPAQNALSAGLSVEHQTLADYALLSNYVPLSPGASFRDSTLARGTNLNGGQVAYPTEGVDGARGPAADRLGLGVFVADTWRPFEALTLQGGLRFDLTQLPGEREGTLVGSQLYSSFGPRFGIALAPVKSLVLRANYGRAYRPPTPQELSETAIDSDFNQGRFVGNPRLLGTNVDAVEVGGEWLQTLGEGRLRLRGLGFYNRLTNPIAQLDTTGNLAPFVNRLEGVHVFGLEGEARLELLRAAVWLNSSWFRAEDLGATQNGRLLTDQPQLRLNAGVTLPLGPFLAFDLIVRHASERRSNARNALEQRRRFVLPPTLLVTAQLRTEPLFDRIELIVLVQNAFDLAWADDALRPDRLPAGVPREPFQIFGTIRVSL